MNTKLKITKQYAQKFDDKCAKVNAHGFFKFITKPNANNTVLVDLIAQVEDTLTIKSITNDRHMNLTEEVISNYMNEFFDIYMPQKAGEVKEILNKTHRYFIDSKGETHIDFIQVEKDDLRSSSVGHAGRDSFLKFNVYIHNSIDDLRTIAHELSHALSSHNQHYVKMIRSNVTKQDFEEYTRMNFQRDCIGEIESHITEKLFNKFLIKKGIYTQSDIQNYEQEQELSLRNEINLIREETYIISKLSCPVSYQSLKKLVKNLEKNNQTRLVERIEKMHDDDKCSYYMFRYVVGRIVADQWIKTFDNVSNKETRQNMLDEFQKYLDRTHKLDLDSACNLLLNKNFECVVDDYIIDKANKNNNIVI